ncbi:MAG: response regulator transcription factor [Anaerolineae bacterium]|nr:response regulator transcription factor [Anaerolineae bacterium]
MIRLMIVEASEALSIGLRMIFSIDRHLKIVAETQSATSALLLAGEHVPDVVVLDVDMPDGDWALQKLVASHPYCRIVVLTIRPGREEHRHLMHLGAFACVEKRSSPQELLNAVAQASLLDQAQMA